MNQIPEEIRNILFPEFLMKELSVFGKMKM